MAGDTVNLHAERETGSVKGGQRLVEVIVNGSVVASKRVPADGQSHDLRFDVPIDVSRWTANLYVPIAAVRFGALRVCDCCGITDVVSCSPKNVPLPELPMNMLWQPICEMPTRQNQAHPWPVSASNR